MKYVYEVIGELCDEDGDVYNEFEVGTFSSLEAATSGILQDFHERVSESGHFDDDDIPGPETVTFFDDTARAEVEYGTYIYTIERVQVLS